MLQLLNGFQKNLDESNSKPNETRVDGGSKFYNRWMKVWLKKNDIGMYLTHNEGKSVVAERTLNGKTYKYMTSISKKCL